MVNDSLLIYAPVPLFRRADGTLMMEDQACNGLRLWAENFKRLITIHPLDPGPPPPAWVPLDRVGENLARIQVEALPMTWRPDRFLQAMPAARRRIGALIEEADYLSFAIGGLFGDWGSVACIEAARRNRAHAVWTDRVESAVVRQQARTGHWRRRLRATLTARPMAALERHLIRKASVGLFHGRETFEAYAPFARRAELVHDIHISGADHITPDRKATKIAQAGHGPLRVVYVGRAEPMKGGPDWVEVLIRLRAKGVDVTATWLGEGSDLAEMRGRIAAAGLENHIRLPGFAQNRADVLEALRAAHLLMFCHKTPESPRNLIEALISATPIVGYGGAYAQGLIEAHQGGVLVSPNDIAALADAVAGLAQDRARLANLIERAARDGAPFNDVEVFRHRSEMIRKHMAPRAALAAAGLSQGAAAL